MKLKVPLLLNLLNQNQRFMDNKEIKTAKDVKKVLLVVQDIKNIWIHY